MGVRPSVLRALAELKYITPSEIQALLIPRALAGVDILGQARTGTGKTAAFAIPLLSQCEKGIPTQAIVLVPTRELAVQVDSEIPAPRAIHADPFRPGLWRAKDRRPDEVSASTIPRSSSARPGRVIDLLDRQIISFENIRFAILDEVDRMLDIGFRDDIRNILSRIKGVRRGEGTEAIRRGGDGRREWPSC